MKNRALTYCQALTPSPCLSIWSLNALSILPLDVIANPTMLMV